MKSLVFIILIWALQDTRSLPMADNSTTAEPGQYPYHGIVRVKVSRNLYPICEGVVIDDLHFLTAAKCVQEYVSSPGRLDIVVGATNIDELESDKNAQIVQISNFYFPKEWTDSQQETGDLVITKVSPPFNVNTYVSPISNTFEEISIPDKYYNLVGFGSSIKLTSLPVKKLSKEACKEKYGRTLSNGTFCAEIENKIVESTDYAGASFADQDDTLKRVYAVYGCAQPGVFIELSYYIDWIEEVVGVRRKTTTQSPRTTSDSSSATFTTTTEASSTTIQSTSTNPPSSTSSTRGTSSSGTTDSNKSSEKRTTSLPASTESDEDSSDSSDSAEEATTTVPPTTESSEESSESSGDHSEEATTTVSPTTESSEESSESSGDHSEEATTTVLPTTESSEESLESSDDYSEEATTTVLPTTVSLEEESSESSDSSEESTTETISQAAIDFDESKDSNGDDDNDDKVSMGSRSDILVPNQDDEIQSNAESSESNFNRNSAQLRHSSLLSMSSLMSKADTSFTSVKKLISSFMS